MIAPQMGTHVIRELCIYHVYKPKSNITLRISKIKQRNSKIPHNVYFVGRCLSSYSEQSQQEIKNAKIILSIQSYTILSNKIVTFLSHAIIMI